MTAPMFQGAYGSWITHIRDATFISPEPANFSSLDRNWRKRINGSYRTFSRDESVNPTSSWLSTDNINFPGLQPA